MLPVLQVGPLAVQTYPLALLIAGWLALEVGARGARRCGIDGNHIYSAGLYALLAAVVGGRLGHVIAYWPAYRAQWLEIFGINTRAFLPWPAAGAAIAIAGWYVYRRRLPLVSLLDAVAPGALVGLAVISGGALLTGRAAGAASGVPWAIPLWGVMRHPSQIYEALAALLIFGPVWRALRQGSRPGVPVLLALAGYGLSRWLLEPFRAESTSIVGGLRMGQVLGLALALAALWGLKMVTTRSTAHR